MTISLNEVIELAKKQFDEYQWRPTPIIMHPKVYARYLEWIEEQERLDAIGPPHGPWYGKLLDNFRWYRGDSDYRIEVDEWDGKSYFPTERLSPRSQK